MKGKHDYFEKKVRDRKTSKTVYGHAYLSKVEVKTRGHGAIFFINNDIFSGDGRSHFGT